jgi:cell volume regulation protein A
VILSIENILLIGSVLIFISVIASKTSLKTGIPILIVFLGVGMLAGSDGIGKIPFDNPQMAQWLGTTALTIILFSGGLDTKMESARKILRQGISLSVLGVLISAFSVGFLLHWILGINLLEGLLIGSIISSTDAAAVFSILRSRKTGLKGNLRPLLELESGSNDPMAYFLTITFVSLILNPEQIGFSLLLVFFQQMFLGAVIGYFLGRVMEFVTNRIKLDYEGLYPVMILAMMFFTYSITDFFNGNGFLAVYLSGIILGNKNFIHKKSVLRFFDGIAWMMQITMFLALGLLVFPSKVLPVMGTGLLIAGILIFIARPLSVFISLAFSRMPLRQRFFISWVGLRGAVPIVFATFPMVYGLQNSELIFHLVFFVVITSVLVQGTTLTLSARLFGVEDKTAKPSDYPLEKELIDQVKKDLMEVKITPGCRAANKSIVQLNFPRSALIVMIKREGLYLTPRGDTVLKPGDKLWVIAEDQEEVTNVMKSIGVTSYQKKQIDSEEQD